MNSMLPFNFVTTITLLFLSCTNANHTHHGKKNNDQQTVTTTQNKPTNNIVDFNIDTKTSASFNPDFYCVSTASMFSYFKTTDQNFLSKLNGCGFNYIQFPGGSISHWNHFVINGSGKGYNIDNTEVQKHGNNSTDFLDGASGNSTDDFFNETIKLCKAQNLGMILVANILTGTQAELEYALNKCKQENIPVKVAMGVELHIKDQRDDFPTAQSYKQKVQSYIDLVRKKFPGVEIAADACPVDDSKADFPFFDEWNKLVATMDFDAYGIYQWAYLQDAETDGNLQATFDKGNQMLTDFVSTGVPNQIAKYKAYFGSKPLWVMQCGVNFRNNGIFGNSMASALFLADYYLWCTAYNAQNNNYLEVVSYQKLGSTNVTCDVITPYKGPKDKMIAQTDIVERSPYYAFELLNPIYQGTKKYDVANSFCNTEKNFTNNIHCYSFTDENNKHYLFIVNKGAGFNLGKINVDGKATKGVVTVDAAFAPDLFSTNGYSNWMKVFPGNTPSQIQKSSSQSDVSKIVVAGYSITRIEF